MCTRSPDTPVPTPQRWGVRSGRYSASAKGPAGPCGGASEAPTRGRRALRVVLGRSYDKLSGAAVDPVERCTVRELHEM